MLSACSLTPAWNGYDLRTTFMPLCPASRITILAQATVSNANLLHETLKYNKKPKPSQCSIAAITEYPKSLHPYGK